jgi:hypothetical protein
MSTPPPPRGFYFHASALALGGHVARPYREPLEAQGSAVLPVVGGRGSARVGAYRFRDFVSFRSATTTVDGASGPDGAPPFRTEATVTVEGLDIGGVVTADRIHAQLVSEHRGDDRDTPFVIRASFENLRIAGAEVRPKPHARLFESATARALREWQGRSRELRDVLGRPLDIVDRQPVLTSLFAPPDAPSGGRGEGGWGIFVPRFGMVYLGELSVVAGERRLTMIRTEVVATVTGSFSSGYVGGNGTTHP